jgi:DNA-binding response OmpR family regulator
MLDFPAMTRILIVDDDPDMAELLGHMTDILGYQHDYVPTGEGALAAIKRQPPDVIILDVMLEETDGWAVYERLTPLTDAPIIFITAWRTGENRQRADDMLADGFLAKPISHQDFAAQIKNALGRPARRLGKKITA